MKKADIIDISEKFNKYVKKRIVKEYLDNITEKELVKILIDRDLFETTVEQNNLFPNEKRVEAWIDENDDALEIINSIEEVHELCRGDIIATIPEDSRYRNDGNYIYDGKQAVELDYDYITDYGSPSKEMIDEFEPDYWEDILGYPFWDLIDNYSDSYDYSDSDSDDYSDSDSD